MPFDPTLPVNNSLVSSSELPNQFTGQKSIMDQAGQGHRRPQRFGRGQSESNVLFSQWRSETGGLELPLRDQRAIIREHRAGEERGGQDLKITAPIDAGLADKGHGLPQCLDDRGGEEVTAELYEIRGPGFIVHMKDFLSHFFEKWQASLESIRRTRSHDV